MSEAKLIGIIGFRDSLISLERFVICDTSGIKSGNDCLIFSKSCIFDCSWARSGLHSDFWDLQNIRRDFSETLVSEGLNNFRELRFGTWIFAWYTNMYFQAYSFWQARAIWLKGKLTCFFLILEPIFPSYIGNSHHYHISVNLLSPTITRLWSITRDGIWI